MSFTLRCELSKLRTRSEIFRRQVFATFEEEPLVALAHARDAEAAERYLELATSADCPVQAFRVGDNTYATQFHPELDVDGICTRIDVYKSYGYFAPDSAEMLKDTARQRNIEYPPTIMRRFVERYARRHA